MIYDRYDCHLHTHFSPCGTPEMTPTAIFNEARELKMTGLCLTDHMHADTPFAQFAELRKEMQSADSHGLDVKIGCEVNVLGAGRYTITPQQADEMDMIVAAPLHWNPDTEKPASLDESVFAEFLIYMLTAALDCPGVRIVAHPLLLHSEPGMQYDQAKVMKNVIDSPAIAQFFRKAARRNIGIEISPKPVFDPYRDLMLEFYRRCLEEKAKLALNSDAHALYMMDIWEKHEKFLADLGVTSSEVLWLPAEQLRTKKLAS